MSIFNSLGSNYDLNDALLSFKQLVWPNRRQKNKLRRILADQFQGKVKLLFNGRDALEYALAAYGIADDDQVLTQALTCSSLEEAIKRTGAEPVYFDLAPNSLHVTLQQIKIAYQQAPQAKAIIVQHGLGYADDIEAISRFCQDHDLLLIEDLAQSVGARDSHNRPVGTLADVVILSFGRDKILDAVAGGAVVFKTRPQQYPPIPNWFALKQDLAHKRLVAKLCLYPLTTFIIRHTYCFGLGKLMQVVAKKLTLLETSIKSPHQHYRSMPAYFAPMAIKRCQQLDRQLAHRAKIAHYYFNRLQKIDELQIPISRRAITLGTNLRFPLLVKSKQLSALLETFKEHGIFIFDRWYRQPVDSGRVEFSSVYQSGTCPRAEQLAKQLLNLPTHQDINLVKANKIADIIINWSQKY